MGVPGLWDVLQDNNVGVRVDISDLQGKTLAVDVSGWIFQSTRAKDLLNKSYLNSPLRNLFWRIKHLVKHHIRPLGVFDGPTPLLKKPAMEKRYGSWNGNGAGTNSHNAKCVLLLEKMGVPYIVSPGEAEATCAVLNAKGIVDGILTDDGDAFLFGAKVVYKDFTVGDKKLSGLTSYSMSNIERTLGLDRDCLIAWGLLVGCDYTDGVGGIGKEKALSLLQGWKEKEGWTGRDILDRFRSWRKDLAVEMEKLMSYKELPRPSHCSVCYHPGTTPKHRKEGCVVCGTSTECTKSDTEHCDCDYHTKTELYKRNKLELKVRALAMSDPDFPDQQIIQAFQNPPTTGIPKVFKWTKPDFSLLKDFWSSTVNMEKSKAVDHVIEYLLDFSSLETRFGSVPYSPASPAKITKVKTVQGTKMVVVEWESCDGVPDAHFPVSTEENMTLFTHLYPDMVNQFEQKQKESKSTGKKRKTTPDGDIAKLTKITKFFPVKKVSMDSVNSVRRKLEFSTPDTTTVKRKKLNLLGTHELLCGDDSQ